ncbi:MAG: hypothetical protein QOE63_2099 [Acidimicrobiaceae bacterium]|jgi:hypothetical protein
MTTSWADVAAAAPELGAKVQARFEKTGLGYLATLRKDGAPRISGLEPLFWDAHLWLGMMDASRKQADVERDPRFALHAANIDKQVGEGDARVSGRAVRVTDNDTFAAFRAAFHEKTDQEPPPAFPLYTVDVTELMHLMPAGDHLLIEWWTPEGGLQIKQRY